MKNRDEKSILGTSLVVRWLRIRLPMQGTWFQSLGRDDPTCHGATKPGHHNYWARQPQLLKPACSRAHVPQLLSPCAATTEARMPRARAPQQEKPPQWEACAPQWRVASRLPQLEKAHTQQRRPNAAKKKKEREERKVAPQEWTNSLEKDCRDKF